MRTYHRVQDGRGKSCLVLEDASIVSRLMYKLSKRRLCFWYERKSKLVLVHISERKAKEVDGGD